MIDRKYDLITHIHASHMIDRFNDDREFAELFHGITERSILDVHRCFILYQMAKSRVGSPHSFAEFGVYKGGTARLLARAASGKRLHLFDTFAGMPAINPSFDKHAKGDFSDTSLESVKSFVDSPDAVYHEGFFPDTTIGVEDSFAFVHVDADIYQSVKDACEWFYPRMVPGGYILFDDYGAKSCPGAKKAVDEFFKDKLDKAILLPTGQSFVACSGR